VSVVEAHTGASEPTFTRLRHKIAREDLAGGWIALKRGWTFGPVKVARDWRGLDEAP